MARALDVGGSMNGDNKEFDYLGDGAYVRFDGFGFTVMANSHTNPTDEVYLEPSAIEALNRFVKRMQEK